MWIKDPKKIVRAPWTLKKKRLTGSVFFGVMILLVATFTNGGIGYALTGKYFNNFDEILPQLPTSIMIGIASGLASYLMLDWAGGGKIILVCPKCEKIKEDDGILSCECGGHFEDIKTMKWVEVESGSA